MTNNQIEKEALEFMQNAEKHKKINQLDKWKDIISLMVLNDAPIVTILDFILLKDIDLSNKYKDRRGTLYSLISKYIKKLELKEIKKDGDKVVNISNSVVKKNSKQKLSIEEQKIKYNISDEEAKKLVEKYGEKFIAKYGLVQAQATQGM